MAVVKTGISLDRELLDRTTLLAQELHVSRSVLISKAIEDYLAKHNNKVILDRLNEVYGTGADPDDRLMLEGMRRLYEHTAERDW